MTDLIAFYLPQFHRVKENDEWWGEGYTEWTAVKRVNPVYKEHDLPRLPTDLGFYDLTDESVYPKQAKLAADHGIAAFCFYYYWFNGRRILEKPLEMILASDTKFQFMICWANENWTRRWDGLDNEVLLKQEHSEEDTMNFIHAVLPILKDERYYSKNRKKPLLVYRPKLFGDAKKHASIMRLECQKEGIDLELIQAESFSDEPPHVNGFDSSYGFPPLLLGGGTAIPRNMIGWLYNNQRTFNGTIHDYSLAVRKYTLAMEDKRHVFYPGVMPSWDNTPRRGNSGGVFHGATPEKYGAWLRDCISYSKKRHGDNAKVFINAWNEWGESAVLEPCSKFGYGFLKATREAAQ